MFSKIKPLLAYWTATDLTVVYEGLEECPCDQVHIKYFNYPYPHIIAEDFFHAANYRLRKKGQEPYTHLILVPNDLVVNRQAYNKLMKNIEAFDYPVISGVCNVDLNTWKDYLNITKNLPMLDYKKRVYKWISKNRYPNMIIQIPFAGFPMMVIKREVLEKTRINWLAPQIKGKNPALWEEKGGYGNDLAFAWNLATMGIPQYADTGINLIHLRYQGKKLVGIVKPIVEFIKAKEIIEI